MQASNAASMAAMPPSSTAWGSRAGNTRRDLLRGPGYATALLHRRTTRGATGQADPHTCPLFSTSSSTCTISTCSSTSCTGWAPTVSTEGPAVCPQGQYGEAYGMAPGSVMEGPTVSPPRDVRGYPMVETGVGLLVVYRTSSRLPGTVLTARQCKSTKGPGLPGAFQEVHHGHSLAV